MTTARQMPLAWQKRWRYDREQGRVRLVDAAPVTRHVRWLIESGMSVRSLALAASVSPSTIQRFRDEHYPTTQRAVARRVMAVRPEMIRQRPDRDGFVPNIGARRRITALLALGWTHRDITAAMPAGQRSQIVLHQEGRWITKGTHDAVSAAYEALSMRRGPSDVTRRRAAVSGYAPPLAWDDETIDDPDALPAVDDDADELLDEVAILRAMRGESVRLTRSERQSAVARLAAIGTPDSTIAGLLHTTDRTVLRDRQECGIESRWTA